MRKTAMMFLSFFALATVAVFFSPKSANAFPGFARKYNFPCSFCHIQWPKLADTGNFFKDRGFMMSTTGKGNGLDMMFEKPGNQNYFPIGFHMSMAYEATSINGAANGPNYSAGSVNGAGTVTPLSVGPGSYNNGGFASGANSNTIWDIESGGLINNWISFWVQPGAGGGSPSLGIVKLWVRFNDLLNTTWFNIYAGVTSQDVPFSNQRALNIDSGAPYTMYDYQPGTPEVSNNNNGNTANFGPLGLSAFYDADALRMLNDHTAIRYFGYHINSPQACMTQSAFSLDPCETRVSVSFIPNGGLYGGNEGDWSNAGGGVTGGIPGVGASNGFSYFIHATQSFGGWGSTNGERIGAFAYIGEASSQFSGVGAASANTVYNRIGFDVATNPIPNGGLNIFGAWEIVNDPAGAVVGNPLIFTNPIAATSGLEYMTWFVEADWQPTFGGFFAASGTNSNMLIFTYNQLNMMQQPTFANVAQLPGNFNNVLEFDITDRYWLWGSDRADISLFASWQWMLNYGVGSVATQNGASLEGFGAAAGQFSNGNFYNVEANNFTVGLDFAY
ncbi:MAG: cytochrome [Nitrospirota bacterium]|nr:cytochrome [Nitrospirota bacterium]